MAPTKKTVDITPDPSLLPKSGQVNYTIPDAVGELFDNAADERIAGELLTIAAYLGQKDGGTISVADDGRGMDADKLANAMRLGYSGKAGTQIGRFGLGMKTACTNLGKRFEIVTARAEDGKAYRVVYDEDAFLAANRWEIEVEEIKKRFPHGTSITITQPKVSIYGGVNDTVATYAAKTFRQFLLNEQIQIVVNEIPVVPFEWDLEPEGKHEFDFEINGKRVYGWMGYQTKVTRKGGWGFDLIRHGRIVKRHEKFKLLEHSKYGKIVGEIFLDDFEVVNNKTDFVRDTPDWDALVQRVADEIRPIALQASRKYSGKQSAEDKARIEAIEDTFETALKSEEFARALDRQMLADVISGELAPVEVEKRSRRDGTHGIEATEDGPKGADVVDLSAAKRPRTPTETREVLRRTRTKLLDLNVEHLPVRFGPQSLYKTWDEEGLGASRRLVVSSNLDHPMFGHVNDTITWVKHNIAEAAAEFLVQKMVGGGIEDVIKIKSDILRFVGELEVAEEELEEGIRAS